MLLTHAHAHTLLLFVLFVLVPRVSPTLRTEIIVYNPTERSLNVNPREKFHCPSNGNNTPPRWSQKSKQNVSPEQKIFPAVTGYGELVALAIFHRIAWTKFTNAIRSHTDSLLGCLCHHKSVWPATSVFLLLRKRHGQLSINQSINRREINSPKHKQIRYSSRK